MRASATQRVVTLTLRRYRSICARAGQGEQAAAPCRSAIQSVAGVRAAVQYSL